MLSNTIFNHVDHIAVAVLDLEEAIDYYVKGFGYRLDCIRETKGKYSGMRSAVLFSGEFSIVLIYSLTPDSQVQRYIDRFGPGVQHMAYLVDDINKAYEQLLDRGMKFSTTVLDAPGLRQVFTKRDPNTGMMHELIQRTDQGNFDEANVNQLFEQLEASNEY